MMPTGMAVIQKNVGNFAHNVHRNTTDFTDQYATRTDYKKKKKKKAKKKKKKKKKKKHS